MNQMIDEESYHLLRRAGFTVTEIDRLIELRRDYRASTPLDYARLQFVRWLVTSGRLTDQIVEEDASGASSLEKKPLLKMIVARMNMKRYQLGLPPSSET